MSNLTGRPVYQKEIYSGKPRTAKQLERWAKIKLLPCSVAFCKITPPEIHHCKTGRGRRKNHDLVAPLCDFHHRGEQGIHTLSRKVWEPIYGTEEFHMAKTEKLLGEW